MCPQTKKKKRLWTAEEAAYKKSIVKLHTTMRSPERSDALGALCVSPTWAAPYVSIQNPKIVFRRIKAVHNISTVVVCAGEQQRHAEEVQRHPQHR